MPTAHWIERRYHSRPMLIEQPDGALRHQCMAALPPGVCQSKFADFVRRGSAKVLEVEQNRLRLRIGRRSLLPWGVRRDVPLDLTIQLDQTVPCAGSLTYFTADVQAAGGKPTKDALRRRTIEVLHELRCSLMAHDLERRIKRVE